MSVSDPYEVLQVDPEAEAEVIGAAYRRLARMYHPDVSTDPQSHAKMIAINQAWEQLRDPAKRAAVDRARRRTSGTAAWIVAADAKVRTTAAGAPSSRPAPSPAARPAYVPPAPGSSGDAPPWPFGMNDPGTDSAAQSTAAGAAGAAGAEPQSPATGGSPLGGFQSGASSRPAGTGAAGPPPGHPSGSVLNFGRFAGWSLGEIARTEIDYLEWLDRMPIGRTYQGEIDELLRAKGRRSSAARSDQGRGGPFRRR